MTGKAYAWVGLIGWVVLAVGHKTHADTERPRRLPKVSVGLRMIAPKTNRPSHTFVVTHGNGGLHRDDRFYTLAVTLKRGFPTSNIYLLDWTSGASYSIGRWQVPWLAAKNIDLVALTAARLLEEKKVQANELTLIGESFGAYVNHGVAKELGQVLQLIALNPASSHGGYRVPDLRQHATQSLSFHTDSVFDTRIPLAHQSVFLKTPRSKSQVAKHTYGVKWLSQLVDRTVGESIVKPDKTTLLQRTPRGFLYGHRRKDIPQSELEAYK